MFVHGGENEQAAIAFPAKIHYTNILPTSKMSTVKVGMFGGSNGDVCDVTGLSSFAPSSLRSMEIWSTPGHEGVINAIRFTFVDSKHNMNKAGPWGTQLPGQKSKVPPPRQNIYCAY